MEKTVTSVEQGKLLIGLGISEDTADLLYEPWPGKTWHLVEKKGPCGYNEIPAWSLAALIKIMPASIKTKFMPDVYNFKLGKYDSYEQDGKDSYCISYYKNYQPMAGDYIGESCPDKTNEDIIDCAVNLIVALVKDNFIKTAAVSSMPDKDDINDILSQVLNNENLSGSLADQICEIGKIKKD